MEERITKLERQCRWYRNLFILAGLIAVALVTWGATKPIPKVIKAGSFQVVNKTGASVADLRAWEGGGFLQIFNSKGTLTFLTAQADDGSGLMTIFNSRNKPMVEIGSTLTSGRDGGGVVSTFNIQGRRMVKITAGIGGVGIIDVNNRNGNIGVKIQGVSSDYTGGLLTIYNKTGEGVVQLEADSSGKGAVGAYDRKGMGRTLKPGP